MEKSFYRYGDYYNEDRFSKMRFDISTELLYPYIENGARILDIGCYDGSMLEALKKFNKKIDYTGIDVDSFALDIALKRGANVKLIDFETMDLPFTDNYFDIVIMAEILEHLRNPAKLIKKAKVILKPTGVILISLPNECTIYHRLKVLLGRGIDGTAFASGYHLHFPTLQQDKEFVMENFKIIKEKHWYHLGVGGFFERMLNVIPEFAIRLIVKIWPALFARGVIYVCQNK